METQIFSVFTRIKKNTRSYYKRTRVFKDHYLSDLLYLETYPDLLNLTAELIRRFDMDFSPLGLSLQPFAPII